MIIIDTNVISMLMERVFEPRALAWFDNQPSQSLWTTTISVMEVRYGLELKPPGRRRNSLEAAFSRVLSEDLEGRVLDFDQVAAEHAGTISARRRSAGRPIEVRDAQIAGIATARGAILATRNTRDFHGLDIEIVSPWDY
ncbi:MAG TPA: type II toxin-antitoxin system VapC family toxin [Rhizomicrobium sp.]|nr:type II toxin-antitoxin system VapC family toxin [Rhizomicrobium sp.]